MHREDQRADQSARKRHQLRQQQQHQRRDEGVSHQVRQMEEPRTAVGDEPLQAIEQLRSGAPKPVFSPVHAGPVGREDGSGKRLEALDRLVVRDDVEVVVGEPVPERVRVDDRRQHGHEQQCRAAVPQHYAEALHSGALSPPLCEAAAIRSGSFQASISGGIHFGTAGGSRLYLRIAQNAETPSFQPIFLPSAYERPS